MNWICKLALGIGVIASFQTTHAQQDSTSRAFDYRVGIYSNSRVNYYGRTDSVRSMAGFAVAEAWLHKKFYASIAPVLLSNKQDRLQYAGTLGTIGFLHKSKKMTRHIFLLKPFFKPGTPMLQAALKWQATASITYETKIFNLLLSTDVKRSNQWDLGATIGLDHVFKKAIHDFGFFLDPGVMLQAGTQHFSNTYYKQKNILLLPMPGENATRQSSKFGLLAIEFSAPLIIKKDAWMLIITPAAAVPVTIAAPSSIPPTGSKNTYLFYVVSGLRYSF